MISITPIPLPSKSIIGYDILQYSDTPPFQGADGNISCRYRLYLSDGSYRDDSATLWSAGVIPSVTGKGDDAKDVVISPENPRTGAKYSDAGQWTDTTAKARLLSILST